MALNATILAKIHFLYETGDGELNFALNI